MKIAIIKLINASIENKSTRNITKNKAPIFIRTMNFLNDCNRRKKPMSIMIKNFVDKSNICKGPMSTSTITNRLLRNGNIHAEIAVIRPNANQDVNENNIERVEPNQQLLIRIQQFEQQNLRIQQLEQQNLRIQQLEQQNRQLRYALQAILIDIMQTRFAIIKQCSIRIKQNIILLFNLVLHGEFHNIHVPLHNIRHYISGIYRNFSADSVRVGAKIIQIQYNISMSNPVLKYISFSGAISLGALLYLYTIKK